MASLVAPLIFGGMGALSGLFSKPKPITTTTDQSGTTDNWNRPVYDPNQLELRNRLINEYLSQLEGGDDYWNAYSRGGMSELARSGEAARMNIENMLASRGIRGAAAGSALAMPMVNQQMQQASFLNSIPQLRDQRRQGILGAAGNFLGSLPYATNQTGSSTSRGTSTQTGGNLSTLGATLAQMMQGAAFGYGAQNQYGGQLLGSSGSNTGGSPNIPNNWLGQAMQGPVFKPTRSR